MKRALLFLFFVIFAGTTANAQFFKSKERIDNLEGFDQQKYSWGFYLVGNNFDYKVVLNPKYGMNGDKNAVFSKGSTGFGAGLIGRMRLDNSFDLRLEPALQFVDRELTFNTFDVVNQKYQFAPDETPILAPTDADKSRTVKSTYLDIPILLEYHGDRWFNSRPYFAGGLTWMLNLQSQSKSTDDNLQGLFRTTSSNFGWTAEMGMQFYFMRFKLTTGVRGVFVMNNELVKDNEGTPPYWAGAINQLNTRAVMLVLKFE